MVGVRSYKSTDERRAALGVYSAILGGGMSSRLFQEIREKRGLTYSVGSYPRAQYGDWHVRAVRGVRTCQGRGRRALMLAEFERMAEGVTDGELERAKGQIAGSTVLRLEDSYSRMSRLGKASSRLASCGASASRSTRCAR